MIYSDLPVSVSSVLGIKACAYLAQGFITTQGKTHCPVQWEVPLLTQTSHKPYSPRFHHSQPQYMNIFLKDTFKLYPNWSTVSSHAPSSPLISLLCSSYALLPSHRLLYPEFLCYSRLFLDLFIYSFNTFMSTFFLKSGHTVVKSRLPYNLCTRKHFISTL